MTQGRRRTTEGQPDKPFRDRIVDSRAVECPSCGAMQGVPCRLLSTGESSPTIHSTRRRLAIRNLNREAT